MVGDHGKGLVDGHRQNGGESRRIGSEESDKVCACYEVNEDDQ